MTTWNPAVLPGPAAERVVRAVLARRRWALGCWAILLALALPGLARLGIDNTPTSFYPEGTQERETFDRFVAEFGPVSALRIVVSGEKLFTSEGLAWLERVEAETMRVPGVAAVDGPLTRRRRTLAPSVAQDPEALQRLLSLSALDRALGFVSRRGDALSLALTLEELEVGARRTRLDAITALAASAPPGLTATVVGLPTLDRALDDAARDVMTRLLPLLAAISTLLLLVTFREAGAVFVPLAAVTAVFVVLLGAMGWCGIAFDLVLAVLPPVVFSIALAVTVHLLIRCRDLEAAGIDAESATVATYVDKGRALVFTTLSTVAGFGALAATPVAPIRLLGLWGAAAMLLVGAVAFTLYPLLLVRTAGPEGRKALPERRLELALERFGRRVAERAADRRGLVLAAYALVAVAAALGFARLQVESNALDYFDEDTPIRRDFARAEAFGMGLATIDLLATGENTPPTGAPAPLTEARPIAALARAAAALRAVPEVVAVVALPDLLDEVASGSPLARAFTPEELRPRLLPLVRADADGERAVARLLSRDGHEARVPLFVGIGDFERIDRIRGNALAAARTAAPELSWSATGELPLLLATQHRLLDTLVASLAWALPLLLLLFLVLLRSLRGALLALVPNVWPVIVILGGMGWLGVPVDIATVMVASIVLGLVVDDTIHTLAPFRELAAKVGARRAVTERLEKSAPAFLLTGLVLASGFAVCALSPFAPVARFGALSVIAIAIALAADLLLVPALFGETRDAKPGEAPVR